MEAADLRALIEAFERREQLVAVICSSASRTSARARLISEHGLSAVVAEHLLDSPIASLVEGAVADLRGASSSAEGT